MVKDSDKKVEIEEKEEEKDIDKEELKEEPEYKKKSISPSSKGNEVTILNILENDLIVRDKKGNGIMVPIPDKRKSYSIGDTIFL